LREKGTKDSKEGARDSRAMDIRPHGTGRKRSRNDRGGRDSRAPFRPDYVVNPAKWTKYDLTNDGTKELRRSGMNAEQVNKYAAFEFLNTLKKNEDEVDSMGNINEGGEAGSSGKVVFKKPTRKMVPGEKNAGEDRGGRKEGGGGRFVGGAAAGVAVMPEYVVGREKKLAGGNERKGKKQLGVLGGRTEVEEEENGGEIETKTSGKSKSSQPSISLSHLDEEDGSDDEDT